MVAGAVGLAAGGGVVLGNAMANSNSLEEEIGRRRRGVYLLALGIRTRHGMTLGIGHKPPFHREARRSVVLFLHCIFAVFARPSHPISCIVISKLRKCPPLAAFPVGNPHLLLILPPLLIQ